MGAVGAVCGRRVPAARPVLGATPPACGTGSSAATPAASTHSHRPCATAVHAHRPAIPPPPPPKQAPWRPYACCRCTVPADCSSRFQVACSPVEQTRGGGALANVQGICCVVMREMQTLDMMHAHGCHAHPMMVCDLCVGAAMAVNTSLCMRARACGRVHTMALSWVGEKALAGNDERPRDRQTDMRSRHGPCNSRSGRKGGWRGGSSSRAGCCLHYPSLPACAHAQPRSSHDHACMHARTTRTALDVWNSPARCQTAAARPTCARP